MGRLLQQRGQSTTAKRELESFQICTCGNALEKKDHRNSNMKLNGFDQTCMCEHPCWTWWYNVGAHMGECRDTNPAPTRVVIHCGLTNPVCIHILQAQSRNPAENATKMLYQMHFTALIYIFCKFFVYAMSGHKAGWQFTLRSHFISLETYLNIVL